MHSFPSSVSSVQAVVFDWAGTMVDFGCKAPVEAFIAAFAKFGVAITPDQARAPMGLDKRAHIVAIGRDPSVAEAWKAATGQAMSEADVDALYDAFVAIQGEVVERHDALIPGALYALNDARERGAKVASTTGYPRAVMAPLIKAATAAGYTPANVVCAGETPAGRPFPYQIYKALLDVEASPSWACVVVDDTAVGIEAGRNAGLWTVACAVSGNEVGMSEAEWRALDVVERGRRRDKARKALKKAGAHYVIDSVAELPQVLTAIEARLRRGEKP